FNYSLICAHAPTEDKSVEEKDSFYDELDEIYGECSKRDCKIIIGDMNAKVGREDVYSSVIGTHSLRNKSNDNGMRLINVASSRNMVVGSTVFNHKDIHKRTWKCPDGNVFNQIDHILINVGHFSDLMDVSSYRGANIDSDHYLIISKIRSRISTARKIQGSQAKKLNCGKLVEQGVATRYTGLSSECLAGLSDSEDVSEAWRMSPEQAEGMTIDRNQGFFEAKEPAPTIKEVEQAIKKLKNNKALGMDLVTAELVKFAGPEYAKHLHQLISKIWITEIIPEEWNLSTVCPIHKKGDVMICSNYRGISLLCIAHKIFSNILFNRLSPFVEGIIGYCQCGFCQRRSTNDHIFTIRHVLEKCNESQIETHHLFIDFRSAYDSIDRDSLFLTMEEMHIPWKLIALVRATMRKAQCQIKIQNMLFSPIITRNGVRQGDSLACLLFNIV
ncbi:hypothetical protein B7P43_G15831, partial [Cryptotermes secundus]